MTRAELAAKYKKLHEEAPEHSLNWFCYGEGYGFLSGNGTLEWAIGQLQILHKHWQERGVEHGYLSDAEYGTYGVYCTKRANFLSAIIEEIEGVEEPEGGSVPIWPVWTDGTLITPWHDGPEA